MNKDPQKHSGLRDGAGHLSAGIAAGVEARSQHEGAAPGDDRAFFREPRSGDPLAEQLGESFLSAATGSEDADDEDPEEPGTGAVGGPFVETTGEIEYALGTDDSNPSGATREPFPTT